MELKTRDLKLLALLQADCRVSNADLAKKTGLSTSACWRRVRALEEAGVIERYGAVLQPARLGLSFQAIVHVQLTRHDPAAIDAFIHAVSVRHEVQECYATTGQADYHLRILCADIDAYYRFLEEFLFRLPAVRSAQTNLVLRQIKCSGVFEI
ncbi:MAG: Lrp/AsnC family transcriptional regulator [Proteobacteria bacterium]|nr:Lrp/AsnC family transcriptional regulator [Pseudomonadota bacterium]